MTSNAVACPVCFAENVLPLHEWHTKCLQCHATLLAPQIPGYKYMRTSCGKCIVWDRVPINETKMTCTCGNEFHAGLFRERLTWCGQEIYFAGVGTPFNAEAELCLPLHPQKIAGTNEHTMRKLRLEKDELELKLKDSKMLVKDKKQLIDKASQRASVERENMEKRLEETADLLENRESELRRIKDNHDRELARATRKEVEMVAEATRQKEELEAVEIAFIQIEASLNQATCELAQLRERNEDAELDVANLTEERDGYKELLELSRAMVDEANEELDTVIKKSEAQKKALEKKEEDLLQLSNFNEDLKSKLEIYIKEYMDKVAELSGAKDEVAELKKKLEEKEKTIVSLRETTKNLVDALSNAQNVEDTTVQKQENDAESMTSTFNQTLHLSLKQGEFSDALKCKYDAAKKRFAKICDEAKEVKEERDRLRQENKQLVAMNTLAIMKIKEMGGAKKEN